jgi:hypothetical protein
VSPSDFRSLEVKESIYTWLSSPSDLHVDHSHQLRHYILHINPFITITTSLNMFIKTLVAVIALAATALSSPTSETSSSQQQTRVVKGEGWTVQGLTIGSDPFPTTFNLLYRISPHANHSADCDTYSYNPFCTYTFNIDVGDYTPDFSCCINDYAPDPQHSSWYSYPCNGESADDGGWVISWGYNPTYDFAVVCLLDEWITGLKI